MSSVSTFTYILGAGGSVAVAPGSSPTEIGMACAAGAVFSAWQKYRNNDEHGELEGKKQRLAVADSVVAAIIGMAFGWIARDFGVAIGDYLLEKLGSEMTTPVSLSALVLSLLGIKITELLMGLKLRDFIPGLKSSSSDKDPKA